MSRGADRLQAGGKAAALARAAEVPLVWTFDGKLARCLADVEDTLRCAIVQVGDVSTIGVVIDVSLPALQRRVEAGESIQPAWADFIDRLSSRYGLPAPPRVRHRTAAGPLVTMVIVYGS